VNATRGVDVSTEVVIARPVEEVAAYAADPTNVPHWYSRISSVQWRTPAPVQQGSQLDFVAQFLGRRLAYTYEVIAYEPAVRMVMRTTDGPFPMQTTYAWTAANDGSTRMTLQNQGEPAGFSRLLAPFVALAVRRANRQDLRRLREILEH
jgi:uncharacterized membrane protein